MGIQGALYSGVSGLNSNSTSMEVIGNNIANSNTYGYKSSRAVFSDALSNAVASSSGSAQLGSGARLSAVDSVFGQGTFESTSSSTDLAIQGDAFFIVNDASSGTTNYTRAGAFRLQEGNLTNPEGYVVQGYDYPSGTSLTDISLSIGDDYDITIPEAPSSGAAGDMLDLITDLDDVPNAVLTAARAAAAVEGASAADVRSAAEAAIPRLESVSVDSDGVLSGVYTDGSTQGKYTIGVATFSNPAGLSKEGNSMYSASDASGAASLGVISETGGDIYSSSLEMSNVDLSQEFVSMITTQRGFQASSKIITTTDELLNEVINLKR